MQRMNNTNTNQDYSGEILTTIGFNSMLVLFVLLASPPTWLVVCIIAYFFLEVVYGCYLGVKEAKREQAERLREFSTQHQCPERGRDE